MDLVHIATWVGIFFCLSQSAMFSGMNLAAFSVSRLRLEVQVAAGNRLVQKTLALRRDANFLLTTILWGNVGINVLLTLLSDSVMTGVLAFCFSTDRHRPGPEFEHHFNHGDGHYRISVIFGICGTIPELFDMTAALKGVHIGFSTSSPSV